MTYVLPDERRDELREPIGDVLKEEDIGEEMPRPLIAVGDMVTATLQRRGVEPDVAVVDYQVERSPCSDAIKQAAQRTGATARRVSNPAGVITDELWRTVEDALDGGAATRIEVDGEEDLAALAAIALAPIGATVLYGLPSEGIARVIVTSESKEKVSRVLEDMEE